MELHVFQTLLTQIKTLNDHYTKINELTGDSFNVFKILKVETSEVKLHSAFIAELLNPKGSHGLKDVFLRHFVEMVCSKNLVFDTATALVQVERYTGMISKDELEGGYIDILITDGLNKRIIIENKIKAGDQKNQLLRYYNFSPGAEIIYLTLDGKSPSDASCASLKQDEHFKCSSYQSDIIQWLEQCRKEAATSPIVRESISQYINLIKYLTNQTLSNIMSKDLDKVLLSNLEASFLIADGLDHALKSLIDELVDSLTSVYSVRGLVCSSNINLDKNYTGIFFTNADWKYVNLAFQFQNYDKILNYGFVCKKDPAKFSIPDELRVSLGNIPNNELKTNNWWPWYNKVEEPFDDWGKYKAYESIRNGSMLKSISEKVEFLLDKSSLLDL
jgi:hypothetical protein